MRIAVIGAGGVGGYLAERLIEAGNEVALLARGAHLAAIREGGLVLEAPDGSERRAVPALATDDPAGLPASELVILAVKGQDLDALIPRLGTAMGETGVALPFLNGVEAPGLLANAFGRNRALIGTARISAVIAAPGRVRQVTEHAAFAFGDLDGRQDRAPVPALRQAFRAAAISAPDCADMRVDLWRKFVSLTAIAGVTAGARSDLGTALATPELRALLSDLIAETVAVATARGVRLPASVAAETFEFLANLPPEMKASLAHDLEAGKALEIDWLSGAVARLGAAAGVPAPRHETIAALLAPHRNGRR
ncbi:2-dehydropantoate 2-reductase [Paralimibaculum aggregatum]|uniref:2-dehydropantoate 2-reductase n=1 Tax=Paralimibaculum aggregatum TaxID=3036245 RepID=A0ABQ6LHU2_9RHOB|nr:2-dehydropantoate 2-reductase [Limibaculum sp. NKW23]GMG82557.1 2-dehydropantoate 2-reductase [Limibaculum sp. NKW23]